MRYQPAPPRRPPAQREPKSGLKSAVLLFGAYVIGRNASIALHELGHALAIWAVGGEVRRIVLHPFAWSYVHGRYMPDFRNQISWAGPLFSVAMGLLLLLLFWRGRHPFLLPIQMTGVVSLIENGSYLARDTLQLGGGDPTSLIRGGTEPGAIYAVGALFLVVGLELAAWLVPRLGLDPRASIGERLLVLGGGILPYYGWSIGYQVLHTTRLPEYWSAAGAPAGMIVLVAIISRLLVWEKIGLSIPAGAVRLGWGQARWVAAAGVATVLVELALFA